MYAKKENYLYATSMCIRHNKIYNNCLFNFGLLFCKWKNGKIIIIKRKSLLHIIVKFSGAKVIDATDKFVIPGGIDPCTNFRGEDLADDLNSGTRAALAGGTTTIMDLVIPDKNQSLIDAVIAWKEDIEELGKKNVL